MDALPTDLPTPTGGHGRTIVRNTNARASRGGKPCPGIEAGHVAHNYPDLKRNPDARGQG